MQKKGPTKRSVSASLKGGAISHKTFSGTKTYLYDRNSKIKTSFNVFKVQIYAVWLSTMLLFWHKALHNYYGAPAPSKYRCIDKERHFVKETGYLLSLDVCSVAVIFAWVFVFAPSSAVAPGVDTDIALGYFSRITKKIVEKVSCGRLAI